jgi:hypothetical protein
MMRSRGHIVFRLMIALLALSIVAYPAAGTGAVAHCCAGKVVKPAADTVKRCCAKQIKTSSSERQGHHAPASSKCEKCSHACCAPVVDVVRITPSVIHSGDVVAVNALSAESVHDSDACDAIFHPPRA